MRNRIKELREAREPLLSQEALAKALGVSRQSVISIEKDKYDPSLKLAFAIAQYFGLTIEEIFDHDDSAPPPAAQDRRDAGAAVQG